MQAPTDQGFAANFQTRFHRRWNHLSDPHVRALTWLLDAPDLLDHCAPQWQGRIATLGSIDHATEEWLVELDHNPKDLHAYLDLQAFTRLGRYAENLMAFYLRHQGILVAHGLQVRSAKNETVGEFDFLLRQGDALVHWEFATKLYLLEADGKGDQADYFIGPGLADTLGAKIRKIMDRQLFLSQHPAAQAHLPQPVVQAQALVKGWLFYHDCTPAFAQPAGISSAHCHGFWRAENELDDMKAEHFAVLPRLSWLAPGKFPETQVLDRNALRQVLSEHFHKRSVPVLIAVFELKDGWMLEIDRGFIVPADWSGRAELRIKGTL